MARTTARVEQDTLVIGPEASVPINVGTPAWYAWLESATTFAFSGPGGSFTARKERRSRGGWYWKAYRTAHGAQERVYLGKSADLTLARLNEAAATLAAALAPPPPPELPTVAVTSPAAHLLATKLFVPPARATLVPRPRLFERLQAGLRDKLTLVAAPAGFGKTTLLSAWRATAEGSAAPLAWVSLDPADNDPLRFWSYVIAALDVLAPGSGTAALALLQSPAPPPITSLLTSVLNAVSGASAAAGRELTLVLDDYHVITTPAIHETLALLLDYLPPALHLVMLTRADPLLPLARMRANGSVTELRAADLRFTPDEAAAFLNEVMGLALSGDDLGALETRTEGWIAGLQLAALAMRDSRDRHTFIRSFSGSNRYIVDYLAAEVFARQPEPVQTFLLRTAILDRMCAPLCDALLGDASETVGNQHPATSTPSSQGVLEELERTNLFVVPLDEERRWYRYHHLFAEVLRRQLAGSAPPAAVSGLYSRASVWYEQQGLVGEAVHHALNMTEATRAADLIAQHGLPTIVGGGVQTALDWLSRLPAALPRDRPFLGIIHALALLFTNDLAAAEARLYDVEHSIGPATAPAAADYLQGYVAGIRANIALYTGDAAGCVTYGAQVLRLLPETEVIARTTARLHTARAFRVSGDVTAPAEQRAIAAVGPIRATQSVVGTLGAVANVALLQEAQGRLRAAAATYRELDPIISNPADLQGPRGLYSSPAYYAGLGDLHREWNELDAADGYLAQALELLPHTFAVDADYVARGYIAQARLQHARGEHGAAQQTLATFADLARGRRLAPHLITRGAAVQAQLALAAGNLAAAVTWADASGLHADDPIPFPRESEYLVLARIWMGRAGRESSGDYLPRALHLLDRLLADASAKARGASVLEILIVQALALWTQGAHPAALGTLGRALALAAPEGYVRRFVDEGPALRVMLEAARSSGVEPDYVARLLAAFVERPPETAERAALAPRLTIPSTSGASLAEPLSERERQVLRLISEGKSNAEVARALVIAVSTVKTHTNSIFGKLGVTSRTQAIARARELQLL
jgi:ATP/maltotriose-dependent transcriptional regulator MalT